MLALSLAVVLGILPAAAGAQGFDILLHPGEESGGEVAATLDLGGAALALHHSESFAFVDQAPRGKSDRFLRESRLEGSGSFAFAGGLALPVGFNAALGEWSSGRYDLSATATSGLRLSGLTVDHTLNLAGSFGAGDDQIRYGSGQLTLAFDQSGGVQEVVLDYEALPLGRVSAFHFNGDWRLGENSTVTLNLSHHLEESLSKAHLGFGRQSGPVDMTAGFGTDDTGALEIGINFTLHFGAPADTPSWSLAGLLAGAAPR